MNDYPNEDRMARRKQQTKSVPSKLVRSLLVALSFVAITSDSMELFNVKFIEQNGSRLIATSNLNYAISGPRLASLDWQSVSVNGDQIVAVSLSGQRVSLTRETLPAADLQSIESLRDEIANSNDGYMYTSTAVGNNLGAGFMMSGSSSSSSMTSSSFSSSSRSGGGGGDMSYSMRDTNNYSIARSDLPFNWSRVFFNDDLVTLIQRNGEVHTLPLSLLDAGQLDAVNGLKSEVSAMQRNQPNTMQSSVNMISSIFDSIMSRFPRPPSYQSAVGNMFGNSFPFGPNNFPFGGGGGGGGGGASAIAIASRR